MRKANPILRQLCVYISALMVWVYFSIRSGGDFLPRIGVIYNDRYWSYV